MTPQLHKPALLNLQPASLPPPPSEPVLVAGLIIAILAGLILWTAYYEIKYQINKNKK